MSHTTLIEFYRAAGLEAPKWINYFVEETQLDDSKDDIELILRAFFLNNVNDTYNRHYRTTSYADKDTEVPNLPFSNRLNFCLIHKLIPFLNPTTNSEGKDEIIITSDLMQDLKLKKIQHKVQSHYHTPEFCKYWRKANG